MGDVETWVLGGLVAWGLYKCSVIASRPTTNKKGVHALAAMLAVWFILLVISKSALPQSNTQNLLLVGILLTGFPVAAIVLAVLGLREIRISKIADPRAGKVVYTQGFWQSIAGLVLAVALLGPLVFYGVSRYLRTKAEQRAASMPPSWTRFTSPAGDFEVQFPGVPSEQPVEQGTPNGTISSQAYVATYAQAIYMVRPSKDPSASAAIAEPTLDAWEKTTVDKLAGQVMDRVDFASDTAPGRELRIASAAPKATVRVRAVVTDGRFYVVMALIPEALHQDEIAERFFASFTIRPPGVSL